MADLINLDEHKYFRSQDRTMEVMKAIGVPTTVASVRSIMLLVMYKTENMLNKKVFREYMSETRQNKLMNNISVKKVVDILVAEY